MMTRSNWKKFSMPIAGRRVVVEMEIECFSGRSGSDTSPGSACYRGLSRGEEAGMPRMGHGGKTDRQMGLVQEARSCVSLQ